MPRISEFFGIVVAMYYRDHAPPHFRARDGGDEATVSLHPLRILEGDLPPRALSLVLEWATLHLPELEEDWSRARAGRPLLPIAPLE